MRETHYEQDEEIQAFYHWIASSKTRRSGIGGSSHVTQCDFIPPSAVKEYLGAPRRVEDLLISIFRNEANSIIDAEVIRQHYLRPFAILLLIGKGLMIKHFVQYRSLQDHHLPYRSRTEDFPFSSDSSFFEQFANQQWQFCAADLEYNMNLHLHKEEILPIIHKEKIGQGGNAVIFKIRVHEEYNKLVPEHWKMPERPPHLRHTFVLKTYRGDDAKEQYTAERDAFMRLRYDGKPSPFVIAYYGSFIDRDTYNIILEYADGGNLEDFMKRTPEPSTTEDMIAYWDRFCGITHGLAHIHGIPGKTETGIPVLLGWHQDIKPANILVFSGSGTSQYDVYFKIADLSLCHFKHSDSLQHDDSDFDAFGTRAYGAPETFRPDDSGEYFPVQVRPDVDIWSIGCVFSEVAVWSRFGWHRVLEYRRRRRAEVKRRLDIDGEDLFHDGRDVLQAVQDMHEDITDRPRTFDNVTVEIVRLLDYDLLLNETEPRYSAKQVFHKSRRIIKATRKNSGIPAAAVPSREDEDHGHVSDPEEEPKTPPSVPPGYGGNFGPSFRRPPSTRVGTFSPTRPMSMNSVRSYSPSVRSATTSRHFHSLATSPNGHDHNDTAFGPFESQSIGLHDLPDPPSPASSYQSSTIDRFNTQDLDNSHGHRRSHRETMGEIPMTGSTAPDKMPLRRSQTEKKPFAHPRRNSAESSLGSHKDTLSPIENSQLPTPPPSSSSNRHHLKSSPEAQRQMDSHPKIEKKREELQRPHLSLQEGLLWKERKKEGYQTLLNGHENLTYLNERDHIFVIDNTDSMRSHRKDVRKVVSLLAYLLKDSDPNGLDVCFTQSTEKKNSGRATKISEVVGKVDFQGVSDMRTRLSQILKEHKNNFGTTIAPSGSWLKRPGPREAQKPLSFYILTDGKWQPNDVGPIITGLVDSMREHKLHKDHVGIQFIRFGQDSRGIDRLNHLDHGLGLKEVDMDIVDTTSWNGNVWKQLLGAINSWYDEDPD